MYRLLTFNEIKYLMQLNNEYTHINSYFLSIHMILLLNMTNYISDIYIYIYQFLQKIKRKNNFKMSISTFYINS